MRKLILVRHSQSHPQPGTPPSQWPLSKEGQRRCQLLATALRGYDPVIVLASEEVKAQQTARALAQAFSVPLETEQLLHEHERTGAPFLSREKFLAAMRAFFSQPDQLIFGNETAAQALERFQSGINSVTATYPDGDLIVVSHGTVLSLFVAHHTGQEPFDFWQRLDQPAYVVFEHPSFRLAATVFTV